MAFLAIFHRHEDEPEDIRESRKRDMGQQRMRILNSHLLVIMLSSGYRMSFQPRYIIELFGV
jgi:hypothetical protein